MRSSSHASSSSRSQSQPATARLPKWLLLLGMGLLFGLCFCSSAVDAQGLPPQQQQQQQQNVIQVAAFDCSQQMDEFTVTLLVEVTHRSDQEILAAREDEDSWNSTTSQVPSSAPSSSPSATPTTTTAGTPPPSTQLLYEQIQIWKHALETTYNALSFYTCDAPHFRTMVGVRVQEVTSGLVEEDMTTTANEKDNSRLHRRRGRKLLEFTVTMQCRNGQHDQEEDGWQSIFGVLDNNNKVNNKDEDMIISPDTMAVLPPAWNPPGWKDFDTAADLSVRTTHDDAQCYCAMAALSSTQQAAPSRPQFVQALNATLQHLHTQGVLEEFGEITSITQVKSLEDEEDVVEVDVKEEYEEDVHPYCPEDVVSVEAQVMVQFQQPIYHPSLLALADVVGNETLNGTLGFLWNETANATDWNATIDNSTLLNNNSNNNMTIQDVATLFQVVYNQWSFHLCDAPMFRRIVGINMTDIKMTDDKATRFVLNIQAECHGCTTEEIENKQWLFYDERGDEDEDEEMGDNTTSTTTPMEEEMNATATTKSGSGPMSSVKFVSPQDLQNVFWLPEIPVLTCDCPYYSTKSAMNSSDSAGGRAPTVKEVLLALNTRLYQEYPDSTAHLMAMTDGASGTSEEAHRATALLNNATLQEAPVLTGRAFLDNGTLLEDGDDDHRGSNETSSFSLEDEDTTISWSHPPATVIWTTQVEDYVCNIDEETKMVFTSVIVDFTGDPQDMSPNEIRMLERTFRDVYNQMSFDECDAKFRQIGDIHLFIMPKQIHVPTASPTTEAPLSMNSTNTTIGNFTDSTFNGTLINGTLVNGTLSNATGSERFLLEDDDDDLLLKDGIDEDDDLLKKDAINGTIGGNNTNATIPGLDDIVPAPETDSTSVFRVGVECRRCPADDEETFGLFDSFERRRLRRMKSLQDYTSGQDKLGVDPTEDAAAKKTEEEDNTKKGTCYCPSGVMPSDGPVMSQAMFQEALQMSVKKLTGDGVLLGIQSINSVNEDRNFCFNSLEETETHVVLDFQVHTDYRNITLYTDDEVHSAFRQAANSLRDSDCAPLVKDAKKVNMVPLVRMSSEEASAFSSYQNVQSRSEVDNTAVRIELQVDVLESSETFNEFLTPKSQEVQDVMWTILYRDFGDESKGSSATTTSFGSGSATDSATSSGEVSFSLGNAGAGGSAASVPTETTPEPTNEPTPQPTPDPTLATPEPTREPTPNPTLDPTPGPTTREPTPAPTPDPTLQPTSRKPSKAPTRTPTPQPTPEPTLAPSSSPSRLPSDEPSALPSDGPSALPVSLPTTALPTTASPVGPTGASSSSPASVQTPTTASPTTASPATPSTSSPIAAPTLQPTAAPTPKPTAGPSNRPSAAPVTAAPNAGIPTETQTSGPTTPAPSTSAPSSGPSISPTTTGPTVASGHPSAAPTTAAPTTGGPTSMPSGSPTESPSSSPTESPTESPSNVPSTAPTASPSASPTSTPSGKPTGVPTTSPSTEPTASPSVSPTKAPTRSPTDSPSHTPSTSPTGSPTDAPSTTPTISPTTPGPTVTSGHPSATPTTKCPSTSPTEVPTNRPSSSPTDSPTSSPTARPSTSPTSAPSRQPTTSPSGSPTGSPTASPSSRPTNSPTALPSASPSDVPTASPSAPPTDCPSVSPSDHPSTLNPTVMSGHPSDSPTTGTPSRVPSLAPSGKPTSATTGTPSRSPSDEPSRQPSDSPSGSTSPSRSPTGSPSGSAAPSLSPTLSPSGSAAPSLSPSDSPSHAPSLSPSLSPSGSASPSLSPSLSPSRSPTLGPTDHPSTLNPTVMSGHPSDLPTTGTPSGVPSLAPSAVPTTSTPSSDPSLVPSSAPSGKPTSTPTKKPTSAPTKKPTAAPTTSTPSSEPSLVPSLAPSGKPTSTPTKKPTSAPTKKPTAAPTTNSPSSEPSLVPSLAPSSSPTPIPTKKPTPAKKPTSEPTSAPSLVPSSAPSAKPTSTPTKKPTAAPTKKPTAAPTNKPTAAPTTQDWVSGYNLKRINGAMVTTKVAEDGKAVLNLGSLPSDMTLCAQINDYSGVDYVEFWTNFGNPTRIEHRHDYCLGHNFFIDGTQYYWYAPELYQATTSLIVRTRVYYTDTSKPYTEYQIEFEIIDDRPTNTPTRKPTLKPTASPTKKPTASPTKKPTASPTKKPTAVPTGKPTETPTDLFQALSSPATQNYITAFKLRNAADQSLIATYTNANKGTINLAALPSVYILCAEIIDPTSIDSVVWSVDGTQRATDTSAEYCTPGSNTLPMAGMESTTSSRFVNAVAKYNNGLSDFSYTVEFEIINVAPTSQPTQAPTRKPTESPTGLFAGFHV